MIKAIPGTYTLIEIRRGESDTIDIDSEATPVFIHDPDIIEHFESAASFMTLVQSKIDQGGRIIRFIADGKLNNSQFDINKKATVVMLSPQESIDNSITDDSAILAGLTQRTILKGFFKNVTQTIKSFVRNFTRATRAPSLEIVVSPSASHNGILKKTPGITGTTISKKVTFADQNAMPLTTASNDYTSEAIVGFSARDTSENNKIIINNNLDINGYSNAVEATLSDNNNEQLNQSLENQSKLLPMGLPENTVKEISNETQNKIKQKRPTSPPPPPPARTLAPPPPPPPTNVSREDQVAQRVEKTFLVENVNTDPRFVKTLPILATMPEREFSNSLKFIGEIEVWKTQIELGNYYNSDQSKWVPNIRQIGQNNENMIQSTKQLYAATNTQQDLMADLTARLNKRKDAMSQEEISENTPAQEEKILNNIEQKRITTNTAQIVLSNLAPGEIPPPPPLPPELLNKKLNPVSTGALLQKNLVKTINKPQPLTTTQKPTPKADFLDELTNVLNKKNTLNKIDAAPNANINKVPPLTLPKPNRGNNSSRIQGRR